MTPADTVRRAVADACGVPMRDITPEKSLYFLFNVHSRRFWEFLASIAPEMPLSAAVDLGTVGDLIRYVEAREAGSRG